MQIIESLEISFFKNLKKVKLENFKDVNIFIGPNNSGKSNILQSIGQLIELKMSDYSSDCSNCMLILQSLGKSSNGFKLQTFGIPTSTGSSYLKEHPFKIQLHFKEDWVKKIIHTESGYFKESIKSSFIEKARIQNHPPNIIENVLKHIDTLAFNELIIKQFSDNAVPCHLSVILNKLCVDYLKNNIILINDSRLTLYKGENVGEYLKNKNLRITALRNIVTRLQEIVDPNIIDLFPQDSTLESNIKFKDSLNNQGSGIRSLICMAADILSLQEGIILIDEPETGLFPHAKRELLKFLTELDSFQIFIATHDPTFLNPFILDLDKNRTNVFIYSPISWVDTPNFIRPKLDEYNPTFCGFLPHTESLKPIHIYVEGKEDVFAIQKLLWENYSSNPEHLNQYSIQHLGGSRWSNFLYTVLPSPYLSLIILDKDKVSEVKGVTHRYNLAKLHGSSFEICNEINDITNVMPKKIPIYCLKSGDAEKIYENDKVKEEINTLLSLMKQVYDHYHIRNTH